MEENKYAKLLDGVFEKLTDEQREKALECKDADALLKMLNDEGVELPDELLDAVAGGAIYYSSWRGWEVYEDGTLKLLARVGTDAAWNQWNAKAYARNYALNHGQSGEELKTDPLK